MSHKIRFAASTAEEVAAMALSKTARRLLPVCIIVIVCAVSLLFYRAELHSGAAGDGIPKSDIVSGIMAQQVSIYTPAPGIADFTARSPININTATAQELAILPGIGESLAEAIISYRERHGHFTSIEELMNISGIGRAKLDSIVEGITVGSQ